MLATFDRSQNILEDTTQENISTTKNNFLFWCNGAVLEPSMQRLIAPSKTFLELTMSGSFLRCLRLCYCGNTFDTQAKNLFR